MQVVSEIHFFPLFQLYDFTAPKEVGCAVVYHPQQQMFACGFKSGAVRVFNVATTSMAAEYRSYTRTVITHTSHNFKMPEFPILPLNIFHVTDSIVEW